LEDRIHKDGKHDQFVEALDKFRYSRKTKADQQDLYDKLEELGADPEEAEEFTNMIRDEDQ
jgi:hypothetical protein